MDTNAKKTYFGITALITGIISGLFLGANVGSSYLEVPPEVFNQLNNLTALIYCVLTPLAVTLGVVGHVKKNDSKLLSSIAIVLVTIPVVILFAQLVSSILRK
jgi:presenilin-like A22 family membrane protease